MSTRYKGGVISATAPTTSTSTAKGIWTATQQMQSVGASVWPRSPGAPTIGTATAGASSATVTYTAPSDLGAGSITYTATSTPGSFTGTGSSPITVSGLTNGTAYTFTVAGATPGGTGPSSAASNSITPIAIGQQAYTTRGVYTWVAPASVTSVSVVAVGAGAAGAGNRGGTMYGGGGGALAYTNNISTTPGSSYTVKVAGCNGCGAFTYNASSFVCNPKAGNGGCGSGLQGWGSTAGTVIAGTGYSGGTGRYGPFCGNAYGLGGGGGGAGGYSGVGGNGSTACGTAFYSNGTNGSGGAGGGGGVAGNGGGVGILGQGSSGTAGAGTISTVSNGTPGSGGCGKFYGGGGGGNGNAGGNGAVRIIWPGTSRSFPSTCTGDL